MVEPDRPQMTIGRMKFACWITKATDTHSKYVKFLVLARQLQANAPQYYVYIFIASLVKFYNHHNSGGGSDKYFITRKTELSLTLLRHLHNFQDFNGLKLINVCRNMSP